MKDLSNAEKVISPSGRYIAFGGRKHKEYIIKKEMPLPKGWRLLLQVVNNSKKWIIYEY